MAKSLLDYHQIEEEMKGAASEAHHSQPQAKAKDYIWGVSSETKAFIGRLKIRLSIKDVHLLFQIVAYAGDSITNESVNKLKEIHDNIEERENMQLA